MSHITLGNQGLEAVEARQWDVAIPKLSKALQSSLNPAWLIGRSKALIGTGQYQQALRDADLAWHSAFDRNKRALMIEAHYRRAVAYFRLKQYANADACCVYAMKMSRGLAATTADRNGEDPVAGMVDGGGFWTATQADAMKEAAKDSADKEGLSVAMAQSDGAKAKEWRTASALRIQILGMMKNTPEDDEGARKWTTTYKPEKRPLQSLDGEVADKTVQAGRTEAADSKTSSTPANEAEVVSKPVVPAHAPLRLQDFQSSTNMSVSIFSKGNDKETLKVDFSPTKVHISKIVYPQGDKRDFVLDLWDQIDPDRSSYSVTPNKVELSLVKANPGKKWKMLQSESDKTDDQRVKEQQEKEALDTLKQARKEAEEKAAAAAAKAPAESQKPESKGPSYPTSSRHGPTNWDKVAEDGAADDAEDGEDVNGFFKKLFKNATPEQQRAMVKSFTESSGTSLSTDWADVGSRKVESVPPEGMEARKWEK